MFELIRKQSVFALKNLLLVSLGIVATTIIFFTYGEMKFNASEALFLVGMILIFYGIYTCCINEVLEEEL